MVFISLTATRRAIVYCIGLISLTGDGNGANAHLVELNNYTFALPIRLSWMETQLLYIVKPALPLFQRGT